MLEQSKPNALAINESDNVAVALEDIKEGVGYMRGRPGE
jgi:hypothetical protein